MDAGIQSTGLRTASVVGAVMMGSAIAVLPAFLIGAHSVNLRADLAMSRADLGLSVSLFFVMSALSSVLAGRVSEAIGGRASLGAAMVLGVTSLASVALFATSLTTLLAFLSLGGVANAFAQTGGNLVLARRVRFSRQAQDRGDRRG